MTTKLALLGAAGLLLFSGACGDDGSESGPMQGGGSRDADTPRGDVDAGADAARAQPDGATNDAAPQSDGGGHDGATQDGAAANEAPTAQDDTARTLEDTPVQITVLDNDSDPEGDDLRIDRTTTPQHGTVSIQGGLIVYTPAENYSGTDGFSYVVVDGPGLEANATAQVTVEAVDDAPLGAPETYDTPEDTSLTVAAQDGVLGNDTDVEGDALTATLVDDVAHGTLSLQPDGGFTYTPEADFFGADSFSYRAVGGSEQSEPVTVRIDVAGVNDAPSFLVGADQILLEDTGARSVPGWATALSTGPANEDGQSLSLVTSTDNPGLFATLPEIDGSGTLSFVLAADAVGAATVSVQAIDDGGTSEGGVAASITQTFLISVLPVNDPPTFAASDPSALEDGGPQTLSDWLSAVSAGPSDESAQTVSVALTSDNPALFAAAPALDSSGNLSFEPAPDAFGSATLTLTATDDGGRADGGADSTIRTFTLTINPVNDPPAFTAGADVAVVEDSGAQTLNGWATAATVGPTNESGQALSYSLATDNDALFAVLPQIAADGTLRFTPESDAVGSANVTVTAVDDGGTADGGSDRSAPTTLVITVSPINDPPTFTAGGDLTVLEDSGAYASTWATGIAPGPVDEAGQHVDFQVSSDNPGLFTAQPAIDSDGELSFEPTADATGSATVTVTAQDDGGVASGGTDTTAPRTFTITVAPVNDPPSFAAGDVLVPEDAGPQDLVGWASAISPGPTDEAGQSVSFAVSSDNPSLFATAPQLSSTGTLSFETAADAVGVATLTVTATDDGGVTDGGSDQSSLNFTLTVTAVNDPPAFAKGGDQGVLEDAGPQTVTGWATGISPGPADEAGQSVSFNVSNDNAALFSSPPAVSPDGTLSYTPAADQNGSAMVTVSLSDDAGGSDTSAAQTFAITISPVNDAPDFAGSDVTVAEDAGAQSLSGWATGMTAGPADEAGQTLTFAVTNDNPGLFAPTGQPAVDATGTLSFETTAHAFGSATLSVEIDDGGGTANGGVEKVTKEYAITVTAVNDPPSFAGGADQSVAEDSGPHSVSAWATAIAAGPPNEVGQTLTFNVSNDNGALFTTPPAVAVDGTLSYTLAPDAHGSAVVSVSLSDDGGGADTSGVQTFAITVSAVNDDPVTMDDSATTTQDLAIDIAVLSNDSDVDLDTLTVVAVGTPSNGTASTNGTVVTYTPGTLYFGSDSFSYTISDGNGGSAMGMVDITVDRDLSAPVLVSSAPVDGDLLSYAEAFGSGAQLAPARFVFDDPLLDPSELTVAVTRNLVPLVQGTEYTVDTSVPGIVDVMFSQPLITPTATTGDSLHISLTGIEDIHGNMGSDEAVTVIFDDQVPAAMPLEFVSRHTRVILQWNEPMDPTSAGGFTVLNETLGVPVTVEPDQPPYYGSGFVSLDDSDDTFYWLGLDEQPGGHTISYNASAMTDLAGNPSAGTTYMTDAVPSDASGEFDFVELRFVPVGTSGPAVLTITAAELVDDQFLVSNVIDGGAYDLLMLLDRSVDSSGEARLEDDSDMGGIEVTGGFETTTVTDDTIRFSPTGVDAGFTWDGGEIYELDLRIYSPSSMSYLTDEYRFALQLTGTDDLAPSVTAVAAKRATASDGAVPLVRPGEGLLVGLSEKLDPRTLTASAFSLVGPAGSLPVAIERLQDGPLTSVRVRAADAKGEPSLLPAGAYTLTATGLDDLSDPPNTMAATPIAFEVGPLSASAPSLLDHAPGDGDDKVVEYAAVHLGFDDIMSRESFTDAGPHAERGLRLEELWTGSAGSAFIPVKGLRDDSYSAVPGQSSIVGVRLPQGFRFATTYRLTPLGGLKSADGVAASGSSLVPFSFTTAADSASEHRPSLDSFSVYLEQVSAGELLIGGSPAESEGRARGYWSDPDGADWTFSWLSVGPAVSESALTSSNGSSLTVTAPKLDTMLLSQVDNEGVLSVTDTDGNAQSIGVSAYRFADASLAAAAPTVTSLGGGVYQFSGTLPDSTDGARVLRAVIFIAEVDTSVGGPPYAIVDVTYIGMAQITRAADGSLSYSHTLPSDQALPTLSAPYVYRAVTQMEAAPTRSRSSDGSSFISDASAAF